MSLIILTANNENLWLFFGPQAVLRSGVARCPETKARRGDRDRSQGESMCRDGRPRRRGWQFRDEGWFCLAGRFQGRSRAREADLSDEHVAQEGMGRDSGGGHVPSPAYQVSTQTLRPACLFSFHVKLL